MWNKIMSLLPWTKAYKGKKRMQEFYNNMMNDIACGKPGLQDVLPQGIYIDCVNEAHESLMQSMERSILYGAGGPEPVGLIRDKSKGWE